MNRLPENLLSNMLPDELESYWYATGSPEHVAFQRTADPLQDELETANDELDAAADENRELSSLLSDLNDEISGLEYRVEELNAELESLTD